MDYIKNNLKLIQKWRWILMFIFLLGSSFEAYSLIESYGAKPLLFELILKQIDSPSILIFYFIILILLMDLGYQDNKKERIEFIKNNRSHIYYYYIYIIFICFLFIIILLLANILTLLLLQGNINLNNEIITLFLKTTPFLAMIISLIFFLCRFIFISLCIFVINKRCKKIPFGYIGGLTICFVDAVAYNLTILNEKPIGIFPFEHSFLESALKYTSDIMLNIIINILYWFIIFSIMGLIIFLIDKSDKNKKLGYSL